LAGAIALSLVAVPGLIHGHGSHANAEAVAATGPSSTSSTSTSIAAARHAAMIDPLHPRTVSAEIVFRHRWETNAKFRMQVAYADATPGQRAALDNYLHPHPRPVVKPPAPKPVFHPVAPRPVVIPHPVAAAPAIPGWTVWDAIAACESSGNWHDNTGNGYSGGLQFSPSTWLGYGGGQFAPQAWEASREQQIVVAERIRAAQGGYQAWPVCGRRV
jgi:hypothetical protein